MMNSLFLALCVTTSSFFYTNEPVVNMREAPSADSKVVSQTIFSEPLKIETVEGDWAYTSTPDHYSGWMPVNSLVVREEPYLPTLTVSRLAAHLYNVQDTEYGAIRTVPFGAKLLLLDDSHPRWLEVQLPDSTHCYIQRGDVAFEEKLKNREELVAFSQQFLGLPYTWGGRSSFGYDCSGFVQMLYSKVGLDLERDSKLQVNDSRFERIALEELQPGDLLFFGKSEMRIMHVGLYLGEGKFIHATARENMPWIRISHLSDAEWSAAEEAYYPYRTARHCPLF